MVLAYVYFFNLSLSFFCFIYLLLLYFFIYIIKLIKFIELHRVNDPRPNNFFFFQNDCDV